MAIAKQRKRSTGMLMLRGASLSAFDAHRDHMHQCKSRSVLRCGAYNAEQTAVVAWGTSKD
eukprot:1817273-Amphidinium_carterae.1